MKTCEARIRPQDSSRKIRSRKHREVASISLGQGQGPKAERLMDIATKAAGWWYLMGAMIFTVNIPKKRAKDPKVWHCFKEI